MRTLVRRFAVSGLLILLSGFGVFAALFLRLSIQRQQAALDEAIAGTTVNCTVTAEDGTSTERIGLVYGYIYTLRGTTEGRIVEALWQERSAALAEVSGYITDLRAMAVHTVTGTVQAQQRYILNVASDTMLDPLNGAEVMFYDGWDDTVFDEEAAVCLITDDFPTKTDKDGTEYVQFRYSKNLPHVYRLEVIGWVSGVEGTVIWTPFATPVTGGNIIFAPASSCSFTIADNTRLDEAKEKLYALFFDPTAPRAGQDHRIRHPHR